MENSLLFVYELSTNQAGQRMYLHCPFNLVGEAGFEPSLESSLSV